ncbi:MAG: hypothetical protein JWM98_2611 [Thermoleophilia bacterium]|nr:hypothetical protein [Thermoleophilia bacterium]
MAEGLHREPLDWHGVAARLTRLGVEDARVVRVLDEGAYSPAHRWIVASGDGREHFVKAARGGQPGALAERTVTEAAPGPWVARFDGWLDAGDEAWTLLVTESLGAASWGAPVDDVQARALRAALDDVAQATPPVGITPIPAERRLHARTWAELAADPAPLVESGLVDQAWCDASLTPLAEAAARADVAGTTLVHGDLWRQNWCWAGPERGAVLVDWTGAALGDPMVNLAWGECGVRACGGPPGLVVERAHPRHDEWCAWMTGLAVRFALDDWAHRHVAPRLHETQLREALAALAWACETFSLPDPGTDSAMVPPGPWRP